MKVAYQAFDRAGNAVSDLLEAATLTEAGETLRQRGLFVTNLAPAGTAMPAVAASAGRRRVSESRRLANVSMFSRQLFVLVSSGTPMVQAISALERQSRPGQWRDVLAGLRSQIEEGGSLSDAMERQGEHFDNVCRSLVCAGETSGSLEEMLDRLATLSRKQLHMRRSITAALVYPCLLISVAVVVLSLLMGFVIPRFAVMFEMLDAPLPATTKVMVGMSMVFRSYWWLLLAALVGGVIAMRHWMVGVGKRTVQRVILRLPQVGRICRSLATARIIRLLGVLLDAKVDVLEALKLVRNSCSNVHYAELLDATGDAVSRGESISSALSAGDLVAPAVCEAVRSGESSGELGKLLLNMADFMDEENEVLVRGITTILEPVILVVLGLLVGLVAISIFMPLFDLTSVTQGGA